MLNTQFARQRREKLGLTQAQLAGLIDVDNSTLSKWESGDREPRSDHLVAWAVALQVDVAQLLPNSTAKAGKEAVTV